MKNFERSKLPERLEIPGLYPPRRRGLPRWPIWLWLVIAAVAAIPAVGIPGVVLAHYTTSNPEFCLRCHATGETPDRSIPSSVHPAFSQVGCVDCHAKPGQIVFEGYVKGFQAEPERVSGNCVRCHPSMPNRTDQAHFKFNERGIAINHQAHIERGATCVTCHSNVAHDTEEPKTNRPRMEACFACHAPTDSCVKCHTNGIPQAEASRETVGRKPVPAPQKAAAPAPQAAQPSSAAGVAPGATDQSSGAAQPAAAAVPAAPAVDPAAIEAGKGIFAKTCSPCHGPSGSSLPTANLGSQSFLEGKGADAIAKATSEGKGGMPAFGSAKGGPLSEQQVRSVVDYLLSAAN